MTREMREDPLDPFPTYGNNELFTIKMYHGGQLSEDFYVGGKVDFFDYCDKDLKSLLEVDNMVEELGYGNVFMSYQYRIPGMEIRNGLKPLMTDSDVINMCKFVPNHTLIDVYIEKITPEECVSQEMKFMKSFEPVAQSRVVIEELDGDDDDQCNLIEERPVQVNRGKGKLAIEYPINSLGGECSVPSQYVTQVVEEVPDERGDRVVGDEVVGEGVPDERVANEGMVDEEVEDEGVADEWVEDEGVADVGDEEAEEEDENDSDFIEDEFPVDEDHLQFMKFVDDHVDAQEDAVLASIREQNNPQSGEGSRQQREEFEEEIDVDLVGDPDYTSDGLHSVHEDEDGGPRNSEHYPEFNEKTDMKNPHLSLGLIFRDAAQFKKAVVMHSMINGYGDVHFPRNEKFKVDAVCKEGCPWLVKCGKMRSSNSMQIKKILDHHTCGRLWMNRNMKQSWLTEQYLERIQLNPTWPVESFMDTIEAEWNHGCSKMKAYRAMATAMKILEGKHTEQYTRLWDFGEEIKKTNPGSTVKIKLDEGRFQRMYVCLGACNEGFKHGCRPLIGLDGCHLKSQHGGQLLVAVGIDPNDETWVIAYAVVEMENKDSWIWFLEILAEDIGIINQHRWTFISDKQKGLIPAFLAVLPDCHHRFCVRHLYTNYREQFKGKALKDALWAVAKTTTIPHFRRAMEELRLLSEVAYDWLMKRPAIHWSRSHFQTHTKCEMLLNNLCESFNAVIVKARSKPIVTMFQIIHTMLMRRIQMRRDNMMRQPGDLCPKIKKKLEVAKIESGRCIAQWSGGTKFQVDAGGSDQFVVDLTERTCSCRGFDLTGLPCSHAIAAINYKRDKPENYVDVCYSKVMYLEIYGHLIQPMNGMSMWEVTENPPIQPLLYTRQPERPKKKRNKEAAEKEKEANPTQNEATNTSGDIPQPQQLSRKRQGTVKCGICKKEGHNTRTHHRHLPTRQEASSSAHGASSNPGGVPRKRGKKPKASSTAG